MWWDVRREASFWVYQEQGIEQYNDLDPADIDFSEFLLAEIMLGEIPTPLLLKHLMKKILKVQRAKNSFRTWF